MPQAKLNVVGIGSLVFFSPVREILKGNTAPHYFVPVDASHQQADFSGAVPGSIQPAHQSPHAGAGDVIDRNMFFFEPFENAYMTESKSAASLKCNSDCWASFD